MIMSQLQSDQQAKGLSPQLQSIIENVRYMQALDLAEAGDLQKAEEILSQLVSENPSCEHMDMLARVWAQEGRLEEARSLWERVVAKYPNHANANAALRRVSRRQKGRKIAIRGQTIIVSILALAMLGFFVHSTWKLATLENDLKHIGDQLSIQPTAIVIKVQEPVDIHIPNPSEEILPELASLEKKMLKSMDAGFSGVSKISAQVEYLEGQLSFQPTDESIYLPIDIPGVTVLDNDSELKLSFENGLYSYESVLHDQGKEQLLMLGHQLEPYVDEIEIIVYGYSDDIEKSVELLNYYRAVRVVQFMTEKTQVPIGIFTIRDPGTTPSPFPNDSFENRSRNRTVVIQIAKKVGAEGR
jgi:tetratricopeptide (TPR) repeat protein